MKQIIEKLIIIGYPENAAKITAKELSQLDYSLNHALSMWIEKNTETDMTVEGFTLSELKAKYKLSYPAALLTIDWLIKEPKEATIAIKKGIK